LHRLPHTTYIAVTMDKTTTILLLWTANDDSGEEKAIIIIDDPSPSDTLRSLSILQLCHRYFYLPASPYCSRRRRGCDCGKTVSIFSPPGPANWTDGKFLSEFIAFHRSVYAYRVRTIYYISFFQKMIPLHYTLLTDTTTTRCVTPLPTTTGSQSRHYRHYGRNCYHTEIPKTTIWMFRVMSVHNSIPEGIWKSNACIVFFMFHRLVH